MRLNEKISILGSGSFQFFVFPRPSAPGSWITDRNPSPIEIAAPAGIDSISDASSGKRLDGCRGDSSGNEKVFAIQGQG
jgi:hypothetical protein